MIKVLGQIGRVVGLGYVAICVAWTTAFLVISMRHYKPYWWEY